MSILLITGDHPRHNFFATSLMETGLICGWVKEVREPFLPVPPSDISKNLQSLYKHHFEERERVEMEFFSKNTKASVPQLNTTVLDLNSEKTINFIKHLKPNLVISYGCHKLTSNLINATSAVFWNTHGGLSPEYRGVTTHFWPSYFLEPQMTGMTLHETTDHLDGGSIIFQTSPPMVAGDTLHQLAARSVREYTKALANKIESIDFNHLPQGILQKGTGRVFNSSDWRPEHLSVIYEYYEDKIVDAVLAGKLTGRKPQLISVI
jgi:folate-dependent phosphoribosylglycinamide formyltransferase PurN